MLISDIIPYERNARNNAKAVPVVAESIREFGLRGTIGLESPENPVIVFGHTRVAACKSLGWTEIPDSKIEYCDDLTEDQVRAFRIADNKTGDVATYNKAMLREEVRACKLDMSRFNCDFKSKRLPYGAERLKTDRAYNLDIVSRADCGRDGFPALPKADALPSELQGFNYAKSTPNAQKAGKGCHFFIDDYRFERLWTYYKFDGEGHIYGDEYGSVIHGFDNVKIIASKKNKPKKAPAESRTPWRIYATVDKETGRLHSITFMDGDGKRYKTIDSQDHKGMGSHAHDGYNHDSDPRKLSRKERRQLAEVRSYIRKYGGEG